MKAISPLVAAVLLIGITMAIAGGLAFWVSSFVAGRMGTFVNETAIAEKCSALAARPFNIYASSYNATAKTLSLVLENKAGIEFKIQAIDIILKNGTIDSRSLDITMPRIATLVQAKIENVEECTSYRILSECPEVLKEGTC